MRGRTPNWRIGFGLRAPRQLPLLLTMRQRQQSDLRKLMCVYGFFSSKRAPTIPHPRAVIAGDEEKAQKVPGRVKP